VPIYVYECEQCSERFEYQQSMKEPPKTVCESCSGKLNKVIVPIAFHLKGGGWYKDLYSSNKPGGGEKKSEGGKSEGGKSEGGKSEGGKSEGGKSEGGKSEGGKSEGGKSEGAKSEGGKSESKKSGGGDQ
jgi:putative FmdB family regulatory protein